MSNICQIYIAGGKLGDFIHALYVPFYFFKTTNKKAIIYITDDVKYGGDHFSHHLSSTYDQLKPILEQQEYIESFHLLTTQKIDNFINLNVWRKYKCRDNWLKMLHLAYGLKGDIIKEPWLKFDNCVSSNIVSVHQSLQRIVNFDWDSFIKINKCQFITTNETEYLQFKFNKKIPLKKLMTLQDIFLEIKQSDFFIGNQSAMLAIAMSMYHPCLGLLYKGDSIHYIGLEQYNTKFKWLR
jgi:hypothetical protein